MGQDYKRMQLQIASGFEVDSNQRELDRIEREYQDALMSAVSNDERWGIMTSWHEGMDAVDPNTLM